MADRHPPNYSPPGSIAEGDSDSFSDGAGAARPSARVDPSPPFDSDTMHVRTDIPERLNLIVPGEAALVYQCLRDRLATLFDDADQ